MVHSDEHPGIFDVAVYGVLHDKWGEVGRAIMTAEDVVEFLKGKIVKFRKGESDVMV